MTFEEESQGWLRIGELSRRVGVSDHVLRAWERRYGLLAPIRSAGGYRLYSTDDERRVLRMRVLLAQGLSAAEAARAAVTEVAVADRQNAAPHPAPAGATAAPGATAEVPDGRLDERRDELAHALESLDEPAAQRVLDHLLQHVTIEVAVQGVVLPYLRDLGDRWATGEITVAQEHFASQVLRGRLTELARGWGRGPGPRALLACPPGERHDLALLAFGVVLSRRGWAVNFLGADTPLDSVIAALDDARPDLVVLAATDPAVFTQATEQLRVLATRARLLLAGPAADDDLAGAVGATYLSGDPVTAAETLAGA